MDFFLRTSPVQVISPTATTVPAAVPRYLTQLAARQTISSALKTDIFPTRTALNITSAKDIRHINLCVQLQ
ncbi:unnamed protein product, partial [Nesidiocoris tenuis]